MGKVKITKGKVMKTKYDFYSDAGHGWLKVKKKELVTLKIADKITSFSYMRGEWAYLEEDDDASTFIMQKKAKGEAIVSFREHVSNHSRIRSYDCYQLT